MLHYIALDQQCKCTFQRYTQHVLVNLVTTPGLEPVTGMLFIQWLEYNISQAHSGTFRTTLWESDFLWEALLVSSKVPMNTLWTYHTHRWLKVSIGISRVITNIP
jgi:hypothetical protein